MRITVIMIAVTAVLFAMAAAASIDPGATGPDSNPGPSDSAATLQSSCDNHVCHSDSRNAAAGSSGALADWAELPRDGPPETAEWRGPRAVWQSIRDAPGKFLSCIKSILGMRRTNAADGGTADGAEDEAASCQRGLVGDEATTLARAAGARAEQSRSWFGQMTSSVYKGVGRLKRWFWAPNDDVPDFSATEFAYVHTPQQTWLQFLGGVMHFRGKQVRDSAELTRLARAVINLYEKAKVDGMCNVAFWEDVRSDVQGGAQRVALSMTRIKYFFSNLYLVAKIQNAPSEVLNALARPIADIDLVKTMATESWTLPAMLTLTTRSLMNIFANNVMLLVAQDMVMSVGGETAQRQGMKWEWSDGRKVAGLNHKDRTMQGLVNDEWGNAAFDWFNEADPPEDVVPSRFGAGHQPPVAPLTRTPAPQTVTPANAHVAPQAADSTAPISGRPGTSAPFDTNAPTMPPTAAPAFVPYQQRTPAEQAAVDKEMLARPKPDLEAAPAETEDLVGDMMKLVDRMRADHKCDPRIAAMYKVFADAGQMAPVA